mmetsp:Transcript_7356/g.18026  ORF Transcript_7356/g.18026 Transcript_7356/m.18026 type:complete len:280 (+) Transcript_7356:1888-2727(+)
MRGGPPLELLAPRRLATRRLFHECGCAQPHVAAGGSEAQNKCGAPRLRLEHVPKIEEIPHQLPAPPGLPTIDVLRQVRDVHPRRVLSPPAHTHARVAIRSGRRPVGAATHKLMTHGHQRLHVVRVLPRRHPREVHLDVRVAAHHKRRRRRPHRDDALPRASQPLRQRRKVSVVRNDHKGVDLDALPAARVQHVHRIDDQRDVRRVLAPRRARLHPRLEPQPQRRRLPAVRPRRGKVPVHAPVHRHAERLRAPNLVEDRPRKPRRDIIGVEHDRHVQPPP